MKRIATFVSMVLALLAGLPTLAAQSPETEIEADIVYGHKDGLAMTMDWYRPAGQPNGAAVIFMVSGGWFSKWAPPENALPLFQPYLDQGFTVLSVRHGSSPRYSIPEAVADVTRAVRFIRSESDRFDVHPQRLGVLGMSAGGHLSLVLSTMGDDGNPAATDPLERVSSRVQAAVALVPPTDLRVAVWEAPESLPAYRNFPALNLPMAEAERFSPVVHATKDDAPSLVIMGGRDELVPPRHGEWIAAAFEREGVDHKLIIFPDAGHGLEGEQNRSRMVKEAVGWFQLQLVNNQNN
jgi:acetyl esterase/lipase